jgi:CSLREA domain-containing protein
MKSQREVLFRAIPIFLCGFLFSSCSWPTGPVIATGIVAKYQTPLFVTPSSPTPTPSVELMVNSTNDVDDGHCDAGHCSLREAMNRANTYADAVLIRFNIYGPGTQTIQPTSGLPELTGHVILDATTQPTYLGTPVIELDGSLAGSSSGLVLHGNDSAVFGLAINRFAQNGVLVDADNVILQRNYIGTDVTGTVAQGNLRNGVLVSGNNNTIGGLASHSRNVISANHLDGVVLTGTRNAVQGNIIGLTAAGNAALGNHDHGVSVEGNINLIGGTTVSARNIISGNLKNGVDAQADAVLVQGNYIGTDVTGSIGLGNQSSGVFASGTGSIQIGGGESGAGNLLSANQLFGVWLDDASQAVSVYGNWIGTDRTGTSALGNIKGGVRAGGTNQEIGASFAGARNVISGNLGPGIAVLSTATGIKIRDNFIGTNISGKGAVGNGAGVEVGIGAGSTDVVIGGAPGEGNVISGNQAEGVLLFTGAKVWNNKIGTDDTGIGALANGGNGILVKGSGNQIGGSASGNTIAFNARHGVAVISESHHAVRNAIQVNSIHDNALLGIALDEDAVIPNDSMDADAGDNDRQNYPVLASAVADANAGSTTFTGVLDSQPSTAYSVELFANASCDSSGNGEGASMFNKILVTTDNQGHAEVHAMNNALHFSPGDFITATATDSNGNTSEFSNCIPVTQSAAPTMRLPETEIPTFTATPTSRNPFGGVTLTPTNSLSIKPRPVSRATSTPTRRPHMGP